MLVLSRRQNEKSLFPNLGISVQVIRIAGKTVRLGVEAPSDVRIVREEIADPNETTRDMAVAGKIAAGKIVAGGLVATSDVSAVANLAAAGDLVAAGDLAPTFGPEMRHALRNRLNTAALGLQLLHRKAEAGQMDDAEPLIFKVFHELHEIEAQLDAEKDARGPQPAARNRRALIVDDNANEGQLLAEYLRMSGYDVEVVDNGLNAIEYLKQHEHPDVVLLDMCMPQLNGPETIKSIRREPRLRGLKVFAVSGADQGELGVESGPRGVDRWFSKPVNARTLVREMDRELDNSFVPA
jgi:carbon storage regulator CsrA